MARPSSLNHVYRTVWNKALGAMVAVAEIGSGRQGSGGAVVCGGSDRRADGLGSFSRLALAVALIWTGSPHALANPDGGVAIHGQASMVSNGNNLTVTTQNGTGTNHSAINWQSFSIPVGSTTQIVQPNAASMSINRVVTNTPSLLFGTLSSNGQVVLVNQAGIAVGAGALVDTAGFTASAVGMTTQDTIAGRLRFAGDGTSNATGALTVQGNIIARGGDVVLIAPSIELAQSAVVEAQGGSVVLAAGQSVEVTGRGLEGITLQVQAPTDQAISLGTIRGDAVGIFAGTLKHSGLIQATQAALEGGRVVLKASGDAYVKGNGRIDATSTNGKGGSIQVLGNHVAVMDNALLDASGATGGGTVLVGGDYQGQNPHVQNANVTYFGANATLKADAADHGDGGKVVVWADDTTRAYGRFSVRGGARGGNGGFVEASGHRYLDFQGLADTGASFGKAGLLLLDPNDITIDNSADILAGGGFLAGIFSGGGGNPTLTWATINAQSGNVEIRTNSIASSGSGDININASAVVTGPTTLTLLANRGLNIAPGMSVSGTGDFNLVAGWNNSGFAVSPGANNNITLGAGSSLSTTGNVWLNAGNAVSGATASITANTLTIGNTNGSSLPGGVNLSGNNMVDTLAVQSTGGGALTFNNGKALSIGAGAFSINGIIASGNSQPINISTTVGNLTVSNAIVSDVLGGAPITLTAAGAIVLNANITSTFNATLAGPVNLVAGAGGISGAAAIAASGLRLVSAGSVSLLGAHNINTLAANVTGSGLSFSSPTAYAVGTVGATTGLTVANGNISLTTAGLNQLLTISQNVQATGGNVSYVTDNLTHNAFTTTNGGLSNFTEVRPFTAATAIEFSPAADAAGVMRLNSGELQFSTPLLKLGNSSMSGGITLQVAVTAVNFPSLSLITGGSITQAAGGILTVSNLNADGATGVTLTELNAVSGKLAGRTTTGNFAFTNASGLVVDQVDINNGIYSTSGNITLIAGGAASEAAGAIVDTLGTVGVTAVGGITFNNNNTGSAVVLNNTGSGSVSYVANLVNVNVSATNVGSGSISLQNVATGGLLTLGNASTGSGNINVTAPGDVTLGTASTSGQVTISSSGGALVDGNAGTLNLTGGVINLVAGTGIGGGADSLDVAPTSSVNAQTTAGSIYLSASSNLPIGLMSAPGTVSLSSFGGGIVDANGASNNIVAASATLSAYSGIGSGDALETQLGTLSASNTMVNDIVIENAGALSLGTLTPAGAGRWLIYAASPASITKNAVTSNFRHYGATASTYPTPSESGNGFIYASAAPALSLATTLATGAASNVFGANPTAAYGYTLTGFADAEDNAGNIGIGGAATFTPTISSTSNAGAYTVNYASGLTSTTGYTFAAGTGLAYTVTPAPLTVSTTNVSKTYDGGLTALGTATLTSGTLFGADSISGGAFAFTNKGVGAGNKIVSVAGVTVNDTNGGGNYSVTYANNTTSTISPATMTIGATASNKVYDGNTTAAVTLSDNRIVGDVLSTSYSTANFVDSSVGTGKTVNVSGISATGTDAGNYTFNTAAVALADITAVAAVNPPVVQADLVVTFLEKFQTAVQDSPKDGDDKEKAQDNLVVEGETCKP